MIADVLTVVWKEWRELMVHRGSLRVLVVVLVFGAFLPWQTGRDWVRSPLQLLFWAWVPLFMVMGVIADAFAGERERHTLETLLASRLSDRAILFGKMGAAVSYGWGIALCGVALGLVTVNLAYGPGRGEGLLLYSLPVMLGILLFSFLGSLLAAAGGTLVSLRAPTVRQAYQTLSIFMLVVAFVPTIGLQLVPVAVRARFMAYFARTGTGGVIAAAGLALVVGCLVLVRLAMARFQRARLILD